MKFNSTYGLWKLRNIEIGTWKFELLIISCFFFVFFLNFLNTCLFLFYKVLCLSSDCLWLRLDHRYRAQRSSDHVTMVSEVGSW